MTSNIDINDMHIMIEECTRSINIYNIDWWNENIHSNSKPTYQFNITSHPLPHYMNIVFNETKSQLLKKLATYMHGYYCINSKRYVMSDIKHILTKNIKNIKEEEVQFMCQFEYAYINNIINVILKKLKFNDDLQIYKQINLVIIVKVFSKIIDDLLYVNIYRDFLPVHHELNKACCDEKSDLKEIWNNLFSTYIGITDETGNYKYYAKIINKIGVVLVNHGYITDYRAKNKEIMEKED